MKRPMKVAVVDDIDHVRDMLVTMLEYDGFAVVEGRNAEDAVRLVVDETPDVLVLDYSMPGTNGLDAAKRVLAAMPKQNIILYTAYIDDALKAEAKKVGVALCVGKVEGLETLERNISELCLKLGGR